MYPSNDVFALNEGLNEKNCTAVLPDYLRTWLRHDGEWDIKYNMTDDKWGENTGTAVERDQKGMYIPCTSGKGFKAKLRLNAQKWS